MQPSGETSEGFGGFDADIAFLYQFFMKMRRIATTGGCITTAPTQESRPRVSPEPAASKGSFPEVLRAAQSPVQSRKRRFGDFLAPAGFCISFCINFSRGGPEKQPISRSISHISGRSILRLTIIIIELHTQRHQF